MRLLENPFFLNKPDALEASLEWGREIIDGEIKNRVPLEPAYCFGIPGFGEANRTLCHTLTALTVRLSSSCYNLNPLSHSDPA